MSQKYKPLNLMFNKGEKMNWKYIVWIGGVDDYYKRYSDAKKARDEWVAKGYDQVTIERITK